MKYLSLGLAFLSLSAFSQTGCGPTTPTVNLEAEGGPLFNVPQDNQDGIGTCYANVSRNVLLGLSNGRDNASYLDLALAFKRTENSLAQGGLDAGNICPTLRAGQAQGFCPQERAALETGARSEIARLMNLENDPFRAQADIMSSLRNFFARTQAMSELPVSSSILPRFTQAVAAMRANPLITFPFPGLNQPFLNGGAFKFAQAPANQKGTAEEYYNSQLLRVKPQIMQAIVQGKTAAEIFDIFSREMTPTLRQMNLQNELPAARESYIAAMTEAMNAPQFRERVSATLEYLRNISGRTAGTQEEFLAFCGNEFFPNIELLNTIGPLLQSLNAVGLNGNSVVDPQGNILPIADVFQVAIAPTCLNPQNRSRYSQNFTCDDNFFQLIKRSRVAPATQMAQVRSRVVESLRSGIPVGRAFPMPAGGGHVNTIVGFRYSQQARACEYLIRDSANGASRWQSEREIFDVSDEMSVVRRVP